MSDWTSTLPHAQPSCPSRERLAETLRIAGIELFSELGIAVEYGGAFEVATADWREVVGLIGFGGPDVAGTLVVSADWSFLGRTLPIPDADADAKSDWIRELANMALGYLKSLLIQRGLRIDLGLPASVACRDLKMTMTSRAPIGVRLRAGGDEVLLGLDWATSAGVVIPEAFSSHKPAAPVDDGDFLFP